MKPNKLLIFVFFLMLAACSPVQSNSAFTEERSTQPPSATPLLSSPGKLPTGALATVVTQQPYEPLPIAQTRQPLTPVTTATPLPVTSNIGSITPTASRDAWKDLPVIPEISSTTREIFQRGVKQGNNPQAFSKIGDCGSTPAWFLGDFDRDARFYQLGDYSNLETAIQVFQGSFSRTSLAAKSGFNASSIFAPLWANRKFCEANESPLACEYRIYRPSFAFIMLGSNDVFHPEEFEPQMRKIIEFSIDQGIVPILSTKADNLEGDGQINATIARLAAEYNIPLWNYWRAVQPLPDHGLQADQVHITWAPNRFNDPQSMTRGWPVRNLNALQILDALWQSVSTPDQVQ